MYCEFPQTRFLLDKLHVEKNLKYIFSLIIMYKEFHSQIEAQHAEWESFFTKRPLEPYKNFDAFFFGREIYKEDEIRIWEVEEDVAVKSYNYNICDFDKLNIMTDDEREKMKKSNYAPQRIRSTWLLTGTTTADGDFVEKTRIRFCRCWICFVSKVVVQGKPAICFVVSHLNALSDDKIYFSIIVPCNEEVCILLKNFCFFGFSNAKNEYENSWRCRVFAVS